MTEELVITPPLLLYTREKALAGEVKQRGHYVRGRM